eukprot:6415316-Prymnesium_polylepis.1
MRLERHLAEEERDADRLDQLRRPERQHGEARDGHQAVAAALEAVAPDGPLEEAERHVNGEVDDAQNLEVAQEQARLDARVRAVPKLPAEAALHRIAHVRFGPLQPLRELVGWWH